MPADHLSLKHKSNDKPHRKRTRRNRSYPVHTLADALEVAHMIQNANSGLGFDRVLLAQAMGTTPLSSAFTMKLISSSRYGLTIGGYNDENIALTTLGEAIVAPKTAGDTTSAIKQAATTPPLFGDFFRKFDGRQLPQDKYIQGILRKEFSVPTDLTAECWTLIFETGRYAKILLEENDQMLVSLGSADHSPYEHSRHPVAVVSPTKKPNNMGAKNPSPTIQNPSTNRIYVGYGHEHQIADVVQSLLDQLAIPHIAIGPNPHHDTFPVSNGALHAMRTCSGAILIMDAPMTSDASNPSTNFLMPYQIGASLALFAERLVIIHRSPISSRTNYGPLQTVEFHADQPGLLGMNLLQALDKAGMVNVSVKPL